MGEWGEDPQVLVPALPLALWLVIDRVRGMHFTHTCNCRVDMRYIVAVVF